MKFNKKKLIGAVLTTVLTLSLSIPVAFAVPSDHEIAEAKEKMDSIVAELDNIDGQLQKASRDVEETQYQIDAKQAEIDELQAQLDKEKDLMGSRMRETYKQGGVNFLQVVLGSTNFEDLVTRIYYLDKISTKEEEHIKKVTELSNKLKAETDELKENKDKQKEIQSALEAKVASYQKKQQEARDYYNSLDAQKQEAIRKEAEKRAEEERRAREAAANNNNNSNNNHNNPPSHNNDIANEIISGGGSNNNGGGGSTPKPTPKPTKPSGGGLSTAYSCIGKPYVWGAMGPNSFDCSGLVNYCYGGRRGRTTYSMINSLKASGDWKTSVSELSVGDLVFPHRGHVGIYIGNNQMIHAPRPGKTVCITGLYGFIGGGPY